MDDYDDEYVDRTELEDIMAGLDDVYLPSILFDSGMISVIGTRAAMVYMYLNRYAIDHETADARTTFDMPKMCKLMGITPALWLKAIQTLSEHNMVVQGFTLPTSDSDELGIALAIVHPSQWVYQHVS